MKSVILTFLVSCLLSTANADTLLRCNPPMGSSLQEVSITQVGNRFFRAELNFAGSYSAPVEISAAAWAKKDLRWESRNEGSVRLYQVQDNGASYWAYRAKSIGSSVIGYCEE